PLHILGATLEALRDGELGDAHELIDAGGRALAWLDRSVRAITDVARLSGHVPRPRGTLRPAALVRRAAAMVAPFCAARHLALTCDLPAPAPAHGNAEDLHHAVMNLLLNAVRFTPDGGRIALTVRAREENAV